MIIVVIVFNVFVNIIIIVIIIIPSDCSLLALSIDKTVCLDMSVLPQIAEGDVVLCTVHADAGETQDCSNAVQYASNGYSATFSCSGKADAAARHHVRVLTHVTGTTLQYKCAMNQL